MHGMGEFVIYYLRFLDGYILGFDIWGLRVMGIILWGCF